MNGIDGRRISANEWRWAATANRRRDQLRAGERNVDHRILPQPGEAYPGVDLEQWYLCATVEWNGDVLLRFGPHVDDALPVRRKHRRDRIVRRGERTRRPVRDILHPELPAWPLTAVNDAAPVG